ncbi:MAG: serine hydrolase [Gammaproteobacteria bacterium]|nr:serine hydrolase [Gammaproteobacteria bacterium]
MSSKIYCGLAGLLIGLIVSSHASSAQENDLSAAVMQGVPPSRDSQVTLRNYREYPKNRWAFRNAGAPLHVVLIPRAGDIVPLQRAIDPSIGAAKHKDLHGNTLSLDALFERYYADGLIVVQGDKVVHERYFNGFNEHAQHIWFSMTKSLVSSAFGLLVAEGKVDLSASPVKYIPELKGSGFERVSIQNVLDHATALAFKENYTDPESDFIRYYAPALSMGYMPGAADASSADTKVYGAHDFLVHFVQPDPELEPGDAFDYNSSNADLLGWLIARISGLSLQDYLHKHIWAKLGAEHDAMIAVDRAYMPVATGGMNSTLRDAARFGMMIRDGGRFNGEQVVPAAWVNASLDVDPKLRNMMSANSKYSADPWSAYHNMWWLLDAEAGEYCAVGIHGQVIYINRKADTTMVWFSSQPGASAANNPDFHSKLKAARELVSKLASKEPD